MIQLTLNPPYIWLIMTEYSVTYSCHVFHNMKIFLFFPPNWVLSYYYCPSKTSPQHHSLLVLAIKENCWSILHLNWLSLNVLRVLLYSNLKTKKLKNSIICNQILVVVNVKQQVQIWWAIWWEGTSKCVLTVRRNIENLRGNSTSSSVRGIKEKISYRFTGSGGIQKCSQWKSSLSYV